MRHAKTAPPPPELLERTGPAPDFGPPASTATAASPPAASGLPLTGEPQRATGGSPPGSRSNGGAETDNLGVWDTFAEGPPPARPLAGGLGPARPAAGMSPAGPGHGPVPPPQDPAFDPGRIRPRGPVPGAPPDRPQPS